MRLGAILLAIACPATWLVASPSLYDQHVLFQTALGTGGYGYSDGDAIAPSTLETIAGRFPVERDHVVSPPSALRLKWRSAPGGDWRMTLRIPGHYARRFAFSGDALTFWVYSDTVLTSENSPRMYLLDTAHGGTPAVPLVSGHDRIPAGQWIELRFPFAEFADARFHSTGEPRFTPEKVYALCFLQGLDDNREHTVYLDDVRIRRLDGPETVPPRAPEQLEAVGFERHVDLSWAPSTAPDVLSYRIYRSTDGRTFNPVATQQLAFHRYADYLGAPPQEAWYRVTAIDLAGNESEPSAAVHATTRAFTDDELLEMTEAACFRYYWDNAHPSAGLAPEVMPGDPNLLATGGNGFGVMALVVGAERGFVTRDAAANRLRKIVRFLARADRFHGAWPHFLNGDTGKAVSFFGKYDDGGDLVETAFMMQGLLAAREYFNRTTPVETEIQDTITRLWHEVEWDWYRKDPDSPVLYWHWSPDHGFYISHPLIGWNETMIVYLLAIASPTHAVPASLYSTGWAGTSDLHVAYRRAWSRTTDGDHYVNGHSYFGIKLDVGEGSGSELFFTHFSFLGFDPRGLRDRFTNYFENNRAIARINRAYCMLNPRGWEGYGPDCWGLSAAVNAGGGRANPRDDNGTISIMASLASMPYTPAESLAALKHFYRDLGPKVWGAYGFHDSFNATQNWFEEVYLALDQGPITVMIENHRTGLLWQMFMANPEIRPALAAIGFKPDPATPLALAPTRARIAADGSRR